MKECDRLKDLMHSLPFDSCVQGRGRNKQHGLVIMYREDRMDFVASRLVHLDEEFLSPPSSTSQSAGQGALDEDEKRRRRGGSRQTKNVGLMVALADKQAAESSAGEGEGEGDDGEGTGTGESKGKGKGIIVATTHL
jgi:RNA exonuclease NGL2